MEIGNSDILHLQLLTNQEPARIKERLKIRQLSEEESLMSYPKKIDKEWIASGEVGPRAIQRKQKDKGKKMGEKRHFKFTIAMKRKIASRTDYVA